MIPELIDIGSDWEVLPPGIHDATLGQIKNRYTWTKARKLLFDGLIKALHLLKNAGCRAIYLDGSFVTGKNIPGDYDVCWEPVGIDVNLLDPVFLDFTNMRKNQKLKFRGEFFPSSFKADSKGNTFIDYFQKDKVTGKEKGIIRILL